MIRLIRGIKPLDGIHKMLLRRNKKQFTNSCHYGPGKIAASLGISSEINGISLISDKIWIEDHKAIIQESDLIITKRVGIDYAEEDASLPYRFILK